MHVDYTEEQLALREQVRSYFAKLMTPELREKTRGMEGGATFKQVVRQMGVDGWLGVGWPREYGGQGKTAIEQQIFFEEARFSGAPIPFVTLNTVGPALMSHGSEEQKQKYLPGILAGEVHFAIGYSEPDAGTDLASLKTSAVRDGDHYVVNGTKIWTSGAGDADYVWLAVRTDPDAPKHKGITILIVDTSDPGFSYSPIEVLNGGCTYMSYYENVRVAVENVVGLENGGWTLITTQLNHERIALGAFSSYGQRMVERTIDWARSTEGPDGRPLAEEPWVQANLAEAFALVEAMKLMNWRMASDLEAGRLDPAGASAVKVYGTECLIDVHRLLIEVVGPAALLQKGSPGAELAGELEQEYRACTINTFGGGVNEVQREIVAMLGLGLPRAAR
ncbi:MAG: acyl-CoA dehydrogenase family protein [Myxococcota bacterium]|nr:acyl-CoA dehydrogenase family protein [Myxococcota bacterium]